jgi:hypothetical protein
VVRAFFPFFNVFAQGWRSDLQRMRPKSGSGWLWKWAATDGLFAMLSGLAAAGLLGAALKALFGGASEYDKTNYNVVPIGWTPGGDFGKQVDYLRFPRSESSRLLSGMTYKLTRLLAGDSPESFTDLLDFGAGSMPSVNPAVQIPLKWTDYFTGHNPEDSFRGRPIIPRTEFQAGGWDSFKPMLKWTLGASGVGNFVSWNEKANTTTELVISAIPGLNKILKTSDFGYGEEQRAVERTEDAQRARHRLAFPESAQELLSERSYLMTVALERRTPEQAMRYEMVNTFYNSVYRPADELAWTLEQNGDKAKAQAMRDGIKVIAEAFAKPKAK